MKRKDALPVLVLSVNSLFGLSMLPSPADAGS
jgi:hypothetical protein